MVKNSQINDQNEIQLNSMEKKMIFWKPSKAQGIEYAWIPRREGSRESTVLSGEISWFERKNGIHERDAWVSGKKDRIAVSLTMDTLIHNAIMQWNSGANLG